MHCESAVDMWQTRAHICCTICTVRLDSRRVLAYRWVSPFGSVSRRVAGIPYGSVTDDRSLSDCDRSNPERTEPWRRSVAQAVERLRQRAHEHREPQAVSRLQPNPAGSVDPRLHVMLLDDVPPGPGVGRTGPQGCKEQRGGAVAVRPGPKGSQTADSVPAILQRVQS